MLQPSHDRPRTFRPRVIPVLLLHKGLLYKTQKFGKPKYVGDPRVAVKIFNDKGADEMIVLDIDAARERTAPNYALIEEIAGECFMPLSYGGGLSDADQVRTVLGLGVEKVVMSTSAIADPTFVRRISDQNGAQAVAVCLDVKRDFFGRNRVMVRGGQAKAPLGVLEAARLMAESGAGEIIIQSIDRDGTLSGYDIGLIREVAATVDIPVIALGGCASDTDLVQAITAGGASAAAAGAMFVFQGPHRAILITYPDESRLNTLLPT